MDGWADGCTDRHTDKQMGLKCKPRIKIFHCYGYSNRLLLKGYAGVKHDPV